jgi:hypothetical protein
MDSYKIIYKIALGEPGSSVSKTELEDAGVNIDALLASGHIEYADKATRPKSQLEE